MSEEIVFKVTNEKDADRAKVLDFMVEWGYRWYQCSPPPTRGKIISAWKNL